MKEEGWADREAGRTKDLPEIVKQAVDILGYEEVDRTVRRARAGIYMARSGLLRAWANTSQIDDNVTTYEERAHAWTTRAMKRLKDFARELKKQKKDHYDQRLREAKQCIRSA